MVLVDIVEEVRQIGCISHARQRLGIALSFSLAASSFQLCICAWLWPNVSKGTCPASEALVRTSPFPWAGLAGSAYPFKYLLRWPSAGHRWPPERVHWRKSTTESCKEACHKAACCKVRLRRRRPRVYRLGFGGLVSWRMGWRVAYGALRGSIFPLVLGTPALPTAELRSARVQHLGYLGLLGLLECGFGLPGLS